MSWNRRLLIVLLVVAVCCLVGWSWRRAILPGLARWLDVGGPPQRVDEVFILPGDEAVRPFVAAAVVNTGFADRALYPQNAASPAAGETDRPPTEEIIRRVLASRGLAEDQIVMLEAETRTTREDLQRLGRYLRERPELRVAVVTSDYHTRRARWLTARLLGEQAAQVSFVSAPTRGFCADDWWRSNDGRFAVTSEYLKLVHVATSSPWAPWAAVGGLVISAWCLLRCASCSGRAGPEL